MSDERWMSKEERDRSRSRGTHGVVNMTGPLLDHAEAADELIAELAAALRQFMPCSCGWCDDGPDERCDVSMTLARVDALTKDTA